MNQKVFLLTPPFTQLNTPYPATAYLKGYLNTQGVTSEQADLGIEVILRLFSNQGLKELFEHLDNQEIALTPNAYRIYSLQDEYIKTIDAVVHFLQGSNPMLAHHICSGNYLPEADRFAQVDDLEWAFGTLGIRDKARHLATLYLEDISDLIIEAVDPNFGFSRYAERLGRSATSFDELYSLLMGEATYIDQLTLELLAKKIAAIQPTLVALSVPFPGNLYSAFKCGQWIKTNYPSIKVVMGGGFPNTELRSLNDPRVFEFVDFITLDDGETPIMHLLEHLEEKRFPDFLKRTFMLQDGQVMYFNGSIAGDVKQTEVGTPDYSNLLLDKYISVIEIANPMHRMWSDGRWNKLTLAHGCYWGKCTFCDISLDYIKNYEASSAKIIVDRIERMIEQTGQNGFHFVDEAAPPVMMREVALEILRRDLTVVWWTNIRFEKSFSLDLCKLLSASGCIAVSGGLEVASDRLLKLIKKGVTVAQVAQVCDNFMQAGILVHAYLMYGFPTQTAQETIDSLEIVRQLIMHEVIKSGFWHQFAMTAHSPVGMFPDKFKVEKVTNAIGTFANNDIVHIDPLGTDHDAFSEGLKKSLFNYMHGICFEFPLQDWFDFKVPTTTVAPDHIERILLQPNEKVARPNSKIVWLGGEPDIDFYTEKIKGKKVAMATITFANKRENIEINMPAKIGNWFIDLLPQLSVANESVLTFSILKKQFMEAQIGDFYTFWYGTVGMQLREKGLLVL